MAESKIAKMQSEIKRASVTISMTTGSATCRYAPDTTNNLGLKEQNMESQIPSGRTLLAILGGFAQANSGQDRAHVENAGSTVRIVGKPSTTYSVTVIYLYT